MDTRTHYEVLGVATDADRETIRRAYIALARASHPDRSAGDADRRTDAAETIRRANDAWAVLGDESRRRAYDQSLRGRATTVTAAPHPDAPHRAEPSGINVPTRTAPLWKWGPVAVILTILVVVLVGSAYATSHDGGGSTTPTTAARFATGQCVDIGFGQSGKFASAVPCDANATGRIWSVVDSPRPCPANTTPAELADGRTTLCLVAVG